MLKSFFRTMAAVASLCAMTASLAAGSHTGGHAANSTGTLPNYEPRFDRMRPVIAVVAYNPSTEITDFVVPYGVLAESGVAEVLALSTSEGPIKTSAGPRFAVHATLVQFDARYPQGADYVVVPNIYEGENYSPLLAWLRQQAARGATIVGICDGVRTLANAGLLEKRAATTHWKTIDRLERKHPRTRWIRNARYIADEKIITTSGVSASIPISIALVEAIAGRARAESLANSLGVNDWSPRHNSGQFRLTPSAVGTELANKLMFWRHEEVGIAVTPGVDEIRVALIADAYSRTRRSPPFTVSASREPVKTRRGLMVFPDYFNDDARGPDRMLSLMEERPPAQALDRALEEIASGYGRRTAAFVALTMEYEWKGANAVRPAAREFGLGPRASSRQTYAATLQPRQLQYGPSRLDRFLAAWKERGTPPKDVLSTEEIAGFALFAGKANCTQCHNGPLLTNNEFHNTGVPKRPGLPEDRGRFVAVAAVKADEFNCRSRWSDAKPGDCAELDFLAPAAEPLERAFKVPSLRNVAERAPYMHAGQFATLAEVLDHYNRAPAAPAGHTELKPLGLSATELRQLEAFLRTLSGGLSAPAKFLVPPTEQSIQE